jgi:hypothetical protein
MLFIGYFSFDEIDTAGQPKLGYFSSIVNAENPDKALAKFETHIRKMRESAEEMAKVTHVYIEEILRFHEIPKTPIITRLQSSDGEFSLSVSHTLPGVLGKDVDAYGFAPDVLDHDWPTDGSFIEAKPFITFGH